MKKPQLLFFIICRATAVLLVSTLLAAGPVPAAEPEGSATDWKKYKLGHLVPLIGSYRFEQVFEDPDVKRAMQEQLGDDLPHFTMNMDVRVPISFISSTIALEGARAHEADKERAILVVDIYNGKIHAGIFSKGRTTIYSKEKTFVLLPSTIREWIWYDEYGSLVKKIPTKDFTWVR